MYEDIVAQARRATEAAVAESRERVDMAVERSQEADKKANEATKAVGERWQNRINAMRRRAAEREKGDKSTEMRFGHEDGPHPNDGAEGDELVSLTETKPSSTSDGAPPFGVPEELARQQQPQPPVAPSRPSPESERFMSGVGATYEEEQPAPTFSPPTRRSPPPRRRPRDDEDDDYSGQSWLEGR